MVRLLDAVPILRLAKLLDRPHELDHAEAEASLHVLGVGRDAPGKVVRAYRQPGCIEMGARRLSGRFRGSCARRAETEKQGCGGRAGRGAGAGA
jgi:hypothetical protein